MKEPSKKITGYIFENPLLVGFIVLAVGVRLVFWLYTGRVWEDSLITLAPARNAWLGNGLTHHLGEPRVHSFTSPMSVLIPLAGEAFNQGLLLLRLTALAAGAATIIYAHNIGVMLRFQWPAQVLVLTYLATDQLQIFFGMAGMETQVATALFLAVIYYFMKKEWLALGIAGGLGMLTRPEFVFCIAVIGLYMLVRERRAIFKVALPFLCIVAPWYLFAYAYYGSIVPNTIVAKSVAGHFGPFKTPWSEVWAYFKASWANIAPFKEWFFAAKIPVPTRLIEATVAVVLLFASWGVMRAVLTREWRILAVAAIVAIFIVYRTVSELSTYYMWYLPPFAALLFLLAAFGLSDIARNHKRIAATLGIFIAVMYAVHMPFTFAAEKDVQKYVECGVRYKTGAILNSMMGPDDSVTLEPLGYISYGAFNKTTHDFPGLSSIYVVHTMQHMSKYGMTDMIAETKPSFVVLRPFERDLLFRQYPELASIYRQDTEIKGQDGITLKKWGYSSATNLCDYDFVILRRTMPPSQNTLQTLVDYKTNDVYSICSEVAD